MVCRNPSKMRGIPAREKSLRSQKRGASATNGTSPPWQITMVMMQPDNARSVKTLRAALGADRARPPRSGNIVSHGVRR